MINGVQFCLMTQFSIKLYKLNFLLHSNELNESEKLIVKQKILYLYKEANELFNEEQNTLLDQSNFIKHLNSIKNIVSTFNKNKISDMLLIKKNKKIIRKTKIKNINLTKQLQHLQDDYTKLRWWNFWKKRQNIQSQNNCIEQIKNNRQIIKTSKTQIVASKNEFTTEIDTIWNLTTQLVKSKYQLWDGQTKLPQIDDKDKPVVRCFSFDSENKIVTNVYISTSFETLCTNAKKSFTINKTKYDAKRWENAEHKHYKTIAMELIH